MGNGKCQGCPANAAHRGTCGAGLVMPSSIAEGVRIANLYPQQGHTYICSKSGMREAVEVELVKQKLEQECEKRRTKA